MTARWRQVLGSTMHCVAGDGIGILAGAAIGSVLTLPHLADISLEYVVCTKNFVHVAEVREFA